MTTSDLLVTTTNPMTTKPTNWRALCAELAFLLESAASDILVLGSSETLIQRNISAASLKREVARIRAYLARPEPEGPTRDELIELGSDHGVSAQDIGPLVTTVLTRWGRLGIEPVPQEPTDEELYDLADVFNGDPVPSMRRALELWGRPAIEPEPKELTDDAELSLKIDALLDGIDRDGCDPKGGWWETSDGARFGRIKLRELKELIAQHQQGRPAIEPEPKELTDEALLRLAAEKLGYEFSTNWFLTGRECPHVDTDPEEILAFARAVIAADRARLGRPAIKPVPVSERLPGPEDCALWPDDPTIPWCWYAREHEEGGWRWRQDSLCNPRAYGYTHWLPHWALPVPTAP